MKLRAEFLLRYSFFSTLTVEAKKSAELCFRVIGNFLRDNGAAIVASQSIGRIMFDLRGRLHDFISMPVSFGVVTSGDSKTC